MYHASVPSLIRSLNNLVAILEKGAAHAEARKIDPAVLINSRLYPDMFREHLTFAISICTYCNKSYISGLLAKTGFSNWDSEARFVSD